MCLSCLSRGIAKLLLTSHMSHSHTQMIPKKPTLILTAVTTLTGEWHSNATHDYPRWCACTPRRPIITSTRKKKKKEKKIERTNQEICFLCLFFQYLKELSLHYFQLNLCNSFNSNNNDQYIINVFYCVCHMH